MKYLVLGGNGMAGHVLVLTLRAHGHDVDVVARSRQQFADTIVLDIRNTQELERVVVRGRYDIVVNCVGILLEDSLRRPDEAVLVNAHLPQRMAWCLRDMSTRFVQLSTDCVFSGRQGPYAENAEPDGQRIYDRTKTLGEVSNDKDLTLRLSIIGPELPGKGAGLFGWFMRKVDKLDGFTEAWWSGVTTIELAKAVEQLSHHEVTGVVHLAPMESITKYELLVRLNQTFGRGLDIRPVQGPASDRRLQVSRTDVPYHVADYDRQLNDMSRWIDRYRDLYPQYDHGVA